MTNTISVKTVLAELNSMDNSKAQAKELNATSKENMKNAFAMTCILKVQLDKKGFTDFKNKVAEKKSEKTSKVLGSFATKFVKEFSEIVSESDIDKILEVFKENELNSWNDFRLFGVDPIVSNPSEFTLSWVQTMQFNSGANKQFCSTDKGRDMMAEGLTELLHKIAIAEEHDPKAKATPKNQVE